jgi:surfeit locus 1 family protein
VKKRLFAGIAFVGVALLTALGAWQVQRLSWKRDLIERVEQRVNAPAVPAPDPLRFDARADEYRRVSLRGHFLNDRETLVQAATRLGGGFWVMTPLRAAEGFTVLVNRGFVPAAQRQPRDWARVEGEVVLTGLLRLDEPGGGFLRDNQPQADRWYSRDVHAIGSLRGVALAPYFVDEEAQPGSAAPPRGPVPGLTVVRFNDNHLQYALTWFALALMLAYGAFRILRS